MKTLTTLIPQNDDSLAVFKAESFFSWNGETKPAKFVGYEYKEQVGLDMNLVQQKIKEREKVNKLLGF